MNDLDTFANQFPKARRHGDFYMVCCPAHEDNNPSCKIYIDEKDRIGWYCFAGCNWNDVGRALGVLGGARPPVKLKLERKPIDETWKKKVIEKIWNESVPISDSDPVSVYLRHTRGLPLDSIPENLRYHPELEYRVKEGERWVTLGKFAGMVAALRNPDGELIAIHRTYLTREGKKLSTEMPNIRDRLVLGGLHGAAIWLGEPDGRLLVGEGIETCLAASLIFKIPSWSAFSSSNLGNILIPDSVEHVYIAVDNDGSGRKAANKLSRRMKEDGKNVVLLPAGKAVDKPGADWFDALEVIDVAS